MDSSVTPESQPATPTPKRRWFRFSLQALLVFVTLCAILCSWLAVKLREAKREEAAAAAIEKAGGRVEWDKDATGPPWLRSVLGEHIFAHITRVFLGGPETTDSTLEHLDALDHLQELYLDFQLTNDGRTRLEMLRFMFRIRLGWPVVTDADKEMLAKLEKRQEPKIQHQMDIIDTNITDAGLEHLQRMKQLTYVKIWNTHVTDEGVKKLQEALPNCKIER